MVPADPPTALLLLPLLLGRIFAEALEGQAGGPAGGGDGGHLGPGAQHVHAQPDQREEQDQDQIGGSCSPRPASRPTRVDG